MNETLFPVITLVVFAIIAVSFGFAVRHAHKKYDGNKKV